VNCLFYHAFSLFIEIVEELTTSLHHLVDYEMIYQYHSALSVELKGCSADAESRFFEVPVPLQMKIFIIFIYRQNELLIPQQLTVTGQ
jgi:hypothetical protein